jgi:pyruvate-formate lyase-activating enzyme
MKLVKGDGILLTHFKGSKMEKDSREIGDFYRIKNYVKPEQMMLHHRYRDFAEPYMVAHHRTEQIDTRSGNTFNTFNRVFTIQVPGCNLDCKGCYVDRELIEGKNALYVRVDAIVEAFMKHMGSTGILRFSGGEPFLDYSAIILLIKEIVKNPGFNPYLWIDTNLLGNYEGFFMELLDIDFYNIGIAACFKGIDHEEFMWLTGKDETLYEKQWENAEILYVNCRDMNIDLFFSVPEVVRISTPFTVHQATNWFVEHLAKIHPDLPLRTTVLTWKNYNANEGTLPEYRFETGMTREIFNEILLARYGHEKVWLPQYQISLEKKDEDAASEGTDRED